MDKNEVGHRDDQKDRIFASYATRHAIENQPNENASYNRSGGQKRGPVSGVKIVAFPQMCRRGQADSVEDAVGDIEEPGAKSKEKRRVKGKRNVARHRRKSKPTVLR